MVVASACDGCAGKSSCHSCGFEREKEKEKAKEKRTTIHQQRKEAIVAHSPLVGDLAELVVRYAASPLCGSIYDAGEVNAKDGILHMAYDDTQGLLYLSLRTGSTNLISVCLFCLFFFHMLIHDVRICWMVGA